MKKGHLKHSGGVKARPVKQFASGRVHPKQKQKSVARKPKQLQQLPVVHLEPGRDGQKRWLKTTLSTRKQ